MKKNKLYTANKWNKSLFASKENMFPNGGALLAADRLASAQYGANYGDEGNTLNDYMNSTNAFSISKADNPFSKMNLQGGLGAMASTPIGGALISGLSSAIGGMVGNAISGGLQSGAGNAISSIGGTIGGAVGQANPLVGAAIGVGSQLAGGLVNAAFGSKVDEAKLKAANEGTAAYNNFNSNASSFDDIEGPESQANVQNAYSGGLFSGRKARRKNRELKRQRAEARSWADRSITNNIDNLASDQLNDALVNYAAFGGPISYNKKHKTSDMIYPAFMNNFAIGGDLQTNGADFTSGLTRVDAGGSHETSPYDGVQVGVDSEGTPNLVEEGETIFDNYVFSNRILADESTKKLFHLPKKKDITFADISKKLEKEIAERPNDPISRAGFKAQMEQLEEQQERQKQEMEATRARAAFEALTPEEQTALMQQVAQQEAAAEQQAIEAQQAQEQAATQQPSPEEMTIDEQQAMAEGQQEIPIEEGYAYGGNLFAGGGEKEGKTAALSYVKKTYGRLNPKAQQAIADMLWRTMSQNKQNYYRPDTKGNYKWEPSIALENLLPTFTSNNQKWYNYWRAQGIPAEAAMEAIFHPKGDSVYVNRKNNNLSRQEALKLIEDTYQKESPKYTAHTTLPSGIQRAVRNGKYWYRGADGKYYSSEKAALNTRTVTPEPAVVEAASIVQGAPTVAGKEAPSTQRASDTIAAINREALNTAQPSVPASTVTEPVVHSTPAASQHQTPTARPTTGKTATPTRTTGNSKNVGTWINDDENHWDVFTRPGLEAYLAEKEEAYKNAPTAEEKAEIRDRVMQEVNGLQESYYRNVLPKGSSGSYTYDKGVEDHQREFDRLKGNTGFYETNDAGETTNLIGRAIRKPAGANTSDNPRSWVDGYAGPQTSIRNFGSTEYGDDDYYANIASRFANMGLTYSPNQDWSYGDNMLYSVGRKGTPTNEMSSPKVPSTPSEKIIHMVVGNDGEELPGDQSAWVGVNPEEDHRVILDDGTIVIYHAPLDSEESVNDDRRIVPNYKDERGRYAGILGAGIQGLMMGAGVGKPNFSKAYAAIDKGTVSLADYQPIGNYLTYRPMDIWFEQNRMDANARGTDRAIVNNSAPVGTKMAGLLASGYNNQIADGELYRKALEYNDALRRNVADFNRGTDMFNAEAYNQTSALNAQMRNQNSGMRARMALQTALQEEEARNQWNRNYYNLVDSAASTMADIGRENAQRNMIARLAASGALPGITPENAMNAGLVKHAAKGGKLAKKKQKKGLTY